MRTLIFFATILLVSCENGNQQKEPFISLLSKCDEVNFNYYNDGDTVHFNTKDSLGIKYLSQAVTGNEESVSDTCMVTGEIFYRSHGDTLIRTEFAVVPATIKKECSYMTYTYQGKTYKHRLTEKANKLLVEMYPKPVADSSAIALDSLATDSAANTKDSIK